MSNLEHGWQPIETIPQPVDGRAHFVLVYIPQPDAMVQHFEVTCATGYTDGRPENVCYGLGGDVPTHWMPLPEPPGDL